MKTSTTFVMILSLLLFIALPATQALGVIEKPPSFHGPVGEPVILDDVHVLSEELIIDLENINPSIEIKYVLDNRWRARTVPLVFDLGTHDQALMKVELNGKTIDYSCLNDFENPVAWKVPDQTPGLDGESFIEYAWSGTNDINTDEKGGALQFDFNLPRFKSELSVFYWINLLETSSSGPHSYKQLVYVLSSAREWTSFGTLDVEIRLPRGWHVASNPELNREGNTLKRTFQGIPGDALTVTMQMKDAWYGDLLGVVFCVIPILIALTISFFSCYHLLHGDDYDPIRWKWFEPPHRNSGTGCVIYVGLFFIWISSWILFQVYRALMPGQTVTMFWKDAPVWGLFKLSVFYFFVNCLFVFVCWFMRQVADKGEE